MSISLKKTAFTDPNIHAAEPTPEAATNGKKSFLDDLHETEREKLLRERKKAFNILFDKADLQPYQEGSALPTGSQSKRAMLDRLEKRTGVGDDDEEDEMSEIQLNLVCTYSLSHDAEGWRSLKPGLRQTRKRSRTTPTCPNGIHRTRLPSLFDLVSGATCAHTCHTQ